MINDFLRLFFLAATLCSGFSQPLPGSHIPKDGFVPNAETAVKIAEAVLIPVYGEKHVLSERPFNAVLHGDVWTVSGTLNCGSADNTLCNGGAAEVKISKSSGQILRMIHER